MKLVKNLVLSVLLLAGAALSARAVTITGFGDADFGVTFSNFTTTEAGVNSLHLAGSDSGSSVYGSLAAPIELGSSTDYLLLTGYYTGTSSARFDISLFDEDGDSLNYIAFFSAFTSGVSSTVQLNFNFAEGTFNGPVAMVGFISNGLGLESIDLTVDHLSAEAVPEPSIWALMAASTGMIVLFFRRRKTARPLL